MKKDVLITIKGIQKVDGEDDVVELTTVGNYYKRKGSYCMTYDESEATGFEGEQTTLSVDPLGLVTMSRLGRERSQLVIEPGVRHQCHYETEYGPLVLGVLGTSTKSSLTDEGGELNFKYSLDINTALASENEVHVTVKEVKKHDA